MCRRQYRNDRFVGWPCGYGTLTSYGAPIFCRLSVGGHSVTLLSRCDSTDSMSDIQQRAECTRSDIGAPIFCRLSEGGHSVTLLSRCDSTDSMSVIQQRAKCTRSDDSPDHGESMKSASPQGAAVCRRQVSGASFMVFMNGSGTLKSNKESRHSCRDVWKRRDRNVASPYAGGSGSLREEFSSHGLATGMSLLLMVCSENSSEIHVDALI
jgi:hypothetical protein